MNTTPTSFHTYTPVTTPILHSNTCEHTPSHTPTSFLTLYIYPLPTHAPSTHANTHQHPHIHPTFTTYILPTHNTLFSQPLKNPMFDIGLPLTFPRRSVSRLQVPMRLKFDVISPADSLPPSIAGVSSQSPLFYVFRPFLVDFLDSPRHVARPTKFHNTPI